MGEQERTNHIGWLFPLDCISKFREPSVTSVVGQDVKLTLCFHRSVTGCKPKASDANFDDLLSGQGFSGTKDKKGPRTIAEMRKEELAKEMDPEKIKAGNCKHFSLAI